MILYCVTVHFAEHGEGSTWYGLTWYRREMAWWYLLAAARTVFRGIGVKLNPKAEPLQGTLRDGSARWIIASICLQG